MIENGIDFSRFNQFQGQNLHKQLDIPEDSKIGIMVGNIRPAKGLDLLIKASRELSEEYLPHFVILGEVPQTEYMQACLQMLKNSCLSSRFFFVGQQNNPIAWIKGADFAVMPSRSESGPLVLVEYLVCGLPFVAFKVGGISERISKFLPDSFVPPENINLFADQLLHLIKKPKSNHNQQTNQSKLIAHNLFDINSRIPSIVEVYKSIMKDNQ